MYTKKAITSLFSFLLVFQVQAVLKRKEEEDQQMKQVVQTLQLALEKEKSKVKDLKDQVGAQRPATEFMFSFCFSLKATCMSFLFCLSDEPQVSFEYI